MKRRRAGCARRPARPIIARTFCAASTARSAADFFSNSARSRSFDGSGGFGIRSPAAAARTFSGSMAAALSRGDFPMSSSTSSLTSPSDEESSSRHGVSSTPEAMVAKLHWVLSQNMDVKAALGRNLCGEPVSYTHLTLPTTLSV